MTRQADILIAAIGSAGFITDEHIAEGAVVVDVGINPLSDPETARTSFPSDDLDRRLRTIEKKGSTLIGDVNQRDAYRKASAFTPVPGGVGLLTVAMLMKNTVDAAVARREHRSAAA